MDNNPFDLGEPFDFDSFITFPPENEIVGGEAGSPQEAVEPSLIGPISDPVRLPASIQDGPLVHQQKHDAPLHLPHAYPLPDMAWSSDIARQQSTSTAPVNGTAINVGFSQPENLCLYNGIDFEPSRLDVNRNSPLVPQAPTSTVFHSSCADGDGRAYTLAHAKEYTCIACLSLRRYQRLSDLDDSTVPKWYYYSCRIPGCSYKEICCTGRDRIHQLSYLSKHEKDHFGQPGHFVCPADHCGFVTKRWSDLRRHSSTIHCTKAKKFPCSVPWCKYTGENGFTRRDKLTSHFNNAHKGVKAAPRGATLAIKPALCKDIASESGTASAEKHDL